MLTARSQAQFLARQWGLPATGTTAEIAQRVAIVSQHPAAWSREDFAAILPYLSVHQDVQAKVIGEHVESILRDGLRSGMVDAAAHLEPGGRTWTWAKGYTGRDAFVFVSGGLQFLRPDGPHLAPRNRPIFHARPVAGGSLWDALATALTPADVGGTPVRPSAAEVVAVGDLFWYDDHRIATVHAVNFGRAEIKIEGYVDGRPSTRMGAISIGECKLMMRAGRARFQDGCLVPPFDVFAVAKAGCDVEASADALTKRLHPRMG